MYNLHWGFQELKRCDMHILSYQAATGTGHFTVSGSHHAMIFHRFKRASGHFHVLEIPNDVYTLLSQTLIGCS